MRVVFTDAARSDLDAIADWIGGSRDWEALLRNEAEPNQGGEPALDAPDR
jgi:plasmid stabilization system protein ParE